MQGELVQSHLDQYVQSTSFFLCTSFAVALTIFSLSLLDYLVRIFPLSANLINVSLVFSLSLLIIYYFVKRRKWITTVLGSFFYFLLGCLYIYMLKLSLAIKPISQSQCFVYFLSIVVSFVLSILLGLTRWEISELIVVEAKERTMFSRRTRKMPVKIGQCTKRTIEVKKF
ncbi:hypothetical protein GEMRC1_003998 [Eukaryota sp. GEM-RC1]